MGNSDLLANIGMKNEERRVRLVSYIFVCVRYSLVRQLAVAVGWLWLLVCFHQRTNRVESEDNE